ncbi:DUF817 family protein [Candidatus Saccharibacteria bacterium]|nr:DUF817 family protein [Candidatus Saccharibacteria bacterium]
MGKQQLLTRLEAYPGGWLIVFFIKQAWAALFGGLMLAALISTKYVTLPGMSRYDWLFHLGACNPGFYGPNQIRTAARNHNNYKFSFGGPGHGNF